MTIGQRTTSSTLHLPWRSKLSSLSRPWWFSSSPHCQPLSFYDGFKNQCVCKLSVHAHVSVIPAKFVSCCHKPQRDYPRHCGNFSSCVRHSLRAWLVWKFQNVTNVPSFGSWKHVPAASFEFHSFFLFFFLRFLQGRVHGWTPGRRRDADEMQSIAVRRAGGGPAVFIQTARFQPIIAHICSKAPP